MRNTLLIYIIHSRYINKGDSLRTQSFISSFIALLVLLLPSVNTYANANPLSLPSESDSEQPTVVQNIRYLPDLERKLSSAEAYLNLTEKDGQYQSTAYFDLGPGEGKYWLYFNIENASSVSNNWRLIASIPVAKLLQVWLYQTEQPSSILTANAEQNYLQRNDSFRFLTSDSFNLQAGETAGILIEYEARGFTRLPLYIDTVAGFTERKHLDDIETAIYYVFVLTLIILFFLFGIAIRHQPIQLYSGLFLLSILYMATTEGLAFQWLWPNARGWNGYATLVLLAILNSTGFRIAQRVAIIDRCKPLLLRLFYYLSLINLVIVAITFWLPSVLLYQFALVFLVMMFIANAYSMYSWNIAGHWNHRISIFAAMVIALLVLLLAMLSLNSTLLPEIVYMNANRLVILLIVLSTMTVLVIQVGGLYQDHENSLKLALAASQREAEINQALFESEQNYTQAKNLANLRSNQMATASHDLRQPLVSMRATLDSLVRDQSDDIRTQMNNALDYLENICSKSLSEAELNNTMPLDSVHPLIQNTASDEQEPYALNLVLETVFHMFVDEAKAKDIDLRWRPTNLTTNAPPLILMRIISNLMSNAVKHTHQGKILLGVRRRHHSITIEVHDNGTGMDAIQLEQVQQAYSKGPDSSGEGLGLAICRQLADQHNLVFFIRSKPAVGTYAGIEIPSIA